jgi:catechol 2,3-dioxygenase-like lactoylglutathione lyase family enzyme
MARAPLEAKLDHLVVMATSLDQGVAWCQATLGITPGPGGQHALMGTHNRLFRLEGGRYPGAYFEIIAIDPQAPAPQRRRWFDMDDATLREKLARHGPQLAHFVVRVNDIDAAVAALRAQGVDRGEVLAASRPTADGLLQWRISVRADGQRLLDGCLPTLIEWGAAGGLAHPAQAMPASGVHLLVLTLQHPQADVLQAACRAIGLRGVTVQTGPASLAAQLQTPIGRVTLASGLSTSPGL